MKRLLLSVFLVTLLPLNAFAISVFSFKDLPDDDRYFDAIMYLKNSGIVEGYEDGTFKPYNHINRAEFTKILVESAGVDPFSKDFNNCFSDVKDEWFARYVCYAKDKGWVDGHPDGTFRPNLTVNKAESVKMTLNALGVTEIPSAVENDPYEDVSASVWFARYVAKAKEINILEEYGIFFYPSEEMTRGAVSSLMYRTLVYLNEVQNSSFLYVDMDLDDKVVKTDAIFNRVVDGDTIEVIIDGVKEKVRLLGIDTPELSSNDCYAEDAKEYMEDLIFRSESDNLVLRNDPMNEDRDKYGRLLRYVELSYGDAGFLMIQKGYAVYYDRFPITLAYEYSRAELYAQGEVLGMWYFCQKAD